MSFLVVVCGLCGERRVLPYCCVVRGRSFLIVVCGLCGERKVLPYCCVWPVW